MTITGLTDNKGNAHVLQRLMTTKFLLSAVLMELAAWIPEVTDGHGLSLSWVPRLQNVEADALTNGLFVDFKPENRIHLDPSKITWKVLPEMIAYGSDLHARSTELKEQNKLESARNAQGSGAPPPRKRKMGSTLR